MASADLKGDGLTDFVLAESTGIQVLLGAGSNQLTAGQFLTNASNALALADVNGDGKADLILTTNNSTVSVLLGDGNGTFQAAIKSNAGASQGALAVGDFNGDGKADLAVIINGSLGVMLGDGTGHLAAPAKLFQLGSQPVSISVGDLNHDGKLDAVVANFGVFTQPASVFVLRGNDDGTFQPATQLVSVPKNAAPIDVELADLNSDGNLDIVVSNNNEVYASIYLGKGDGIFQAPLRLTPPLPRRR